MIMLKTPIKDRLSTDYNERKPKGTAVLYDRINYSATCLHGIKVRVISPWRKPIWLDAGWLESWRVSR